MNSDKPDIYIFSPFCLLRPSTNRIFDMRLADSFAGHGCRVTVIFPYTWMKENISSKEIPRSYGLVNRVNTRMQYIPLFEKSAGWYRVIFMLSASKISTLRIYFRQIFGTRQAVIFSRDAKSLLMPILFRRIFGKKILRTKIIFMAAEVKNTRIYKWVINNADGIFAGVSATRDAIASIANVSPAKFILALAPVPVYKNEISRAEARKQIGYSEPKPLIVYTGKLGLDVQEVIYLFETAALLSEYNFLFTGGRASTIETVKKYCEKKQITNCIFTGFLNDSTAIRKYQLAADVLVSYYTSKDHMIEFNYPQKINEYMSTGNPIVTPDFPATRDVLNDRNVYFVKADDPSSLATGIKKLIEDPDAASRLALQAREDVREITFESRTAELLKFINTL
jgi:glycosyltransferase involved in cell wall biosynthesis